MKIRNNFIFYSLFFILVLAAILRLWNLADVPPSLTPDEASLGYNAYTILHTGKDMWGSPLPVIFKSFGDYTPGLYVYLTVPFVALFGLNEWSVRLPNALMGILVVWLMYQITRLLFNHTEVQLRHPEFISGSASMGKRQIPGQARNDRYVELLPVLAAFLAAVNPWLIMFSRGAWLPNVCLSLSLLGLYCLLIACRNAKYLLLTAISFGLALLSYQGAKLSVAIIGVLFLVIYRKELLRIDKKILGASLVVGLLISFPIILSVFNGNASRLSVVSVFSYPRSQEEVSHVLMQGNESVSSVTALLFHSEKLQFARVILGKWFNHFSGRFLFFEGDWENPRFSSPYQGMLLLIDLLLLPLGFYALSQTKGKGKWSILLWLVLAPLPAILSRDQVHAARSLNMSIPLIIISGFGLRWIIMKISQSKNILFRACFVCILVGTFTISLMYYFDSYYVHLPKHNAKHWDYGYKEVVLELSKNGYLQDGRQVIMQQSYEQPFIYFLFYQPSLRSNYIQYEESIVGDVGVVKQLGENTFQGLSYPFQFPKGTIVVADEVAAPVSLINSDFIIRKEIQRPDGTVAFRLLEAK